jgi:hypothetical protein
MFDEILAVMAMAYNAFGTFPILLQQTLPFSHSAIGKRQACMKMIGLARHSVSAPTKMWWLRFCHSAAAARISWKLLFGAYVVQGDTIGRSDTRVGSVL